MQNFLPMTTSPFTPTLSTSTSAIPSPASPFSPVVLIRSGGTTPVSPLADSPLPFVELASTPVASLSNSPLDKSWVQHSSAPTSNNTDTFRPRPEVKRTSHSLEHLFSPSSPVARPSENFLLRRAATTRGDLHSLRKPKEGEKGREKEGPPLSPTTPTSPTPTTDSTTPQQHPHSKDNIPRATTAPSMHNYVINNYGTTTTPINISASGPIPRRHLHRSQEGPHASDADEGVEPHKKLRKSLTPKRLRRLSLSIMSGETQDVATSNRESTLSQNN